MDHLVEEKIETVTFDSLVQSESIDRADVIQIDTEDHDYVIFQQIDFDQLKTKLVHIELMHIAPPDRMKVFEEVERRGFRYGFDGDNLTAVRYWSATHAEPLQNT